MFGSVVAERLTNHGKTCLVVDKSPHIGGTCYTEEIAGITVHKYGAHILHTNNKTVYDYLARFCELENYCHQVVADYNGKILPLPFNMNTFNALWGVVSPLEAKEKIESQRVPCEDVKTLKDLALSTVGTDIYEKLIKSYTEKQWQRKCQDLPSSILSAIPLRFTYNNNYFSHSYQAVPKHGYTALFERLLQNADVKLNTCYKQGKHEADKIIYTGAIDEYFDYCFGRLEYRSLYFEHDDFSAHENFQGCAVVNYTSSNEPFTRIIEHKHFDKNCDASGTVITREYPEEFNGTNERYYPIETERNLAIYEKYRELAEGSSNVIFAGRLGEYRYIRMSETVELALKLADEELKSGE